MKWPSDLVCSSRSCGAGRAASAASFVFFFLTSGLFPTSVLFNVANQGVRHGHSLPSSPRKLWSLHQGITPLSSPLPANPEDQWQREISEKGEVSCPTCSVISRKTVVGLKKHMDVCQKVWACLIQSCTLDFGA